MADLAAFAFELGCGFVTASLFREPTRTVQPDAASWRATSEPMPLFAPVLRMSIEKRAKLPNQMHPRERNGHRDP